MRADVGDLKQEVSWWTTAAAILLTLLPVWFAVSQVVMALQGWRLMPSGEIKGNENAWVHCRPELASPEIQMTSTPVVARTGQRPRCGLCKAFWNWSWQNVDVLSLRAYYEKGETLLGSKNWAGSSRCFGNCGGHPAPSTNAYDVGVDGHRQAGAEDCVSEGQRCAAEGGGARLGLIDGQWPISVRRGQNHRRRIDQRIDVFCKEFFNEESADLCRQLTETLARKRPAPLLQGRLENRCFRRPAGID